MWKFIQTHKLFLAQSLIFLFLSLSFILPSGNYNCLNDICSLSIGSWHLHDSLWHLSLVNLGFDSWPLQNPFLAGEPLSNYNFLIDYVIYLLSRLGVPPLLSFFKILPIFGALLYVWSVAKFVRLTTSGQLKQNLLAFFLYFGSSFSYLATLYKGDGLYYATLRGFPVVSSITPTTMFLNLQFAFSLSLVLWIIMIIRDRNRPAKPLFLGILFFALFGLKFYGGVVAFLLLLGNSLRSIIYRRYTRSHFLELIVIGVFCLASLAIFYGFSGESSSPFAWAPFALTRLMIDDPLLFYNHSLTLARYYLYENLVGFSPRLVAIELYSLGLFFIFNFGTRVIGIFYGLIAIIKKRINFDSLLVLILILITALIPVLFVQRGGWYNTMQFLYYGTWLSGLLLAELLYKLSTSKLPGKMFFLALVIIFTLPTLLDQFRYLQAEQVVIGHDELAMLNTLKALPPGVVHITNPEFKNALVPALAHKPAYYLDTDQLMVIDAPYLDRLATIKKYSGGSITSVPAAYYLVYKSEYGSEAAITALSNPQVFELTYDSADLALYIRR